MIFCLPQLRRPAWVFGNCCAGTVTRAESTNTHTRTLSRVGGVPAALGAGAHGGLVAGGEDAGVLGLLADLGPGEDEAADEADKDGGNAAESDGGVEEDQAADGDGELVERADHRIGGGRCHADAPGGAVRDEDGGQARVDHADHELVARLLGEVAGQVLGGPVLDQERADDQDGDGEEVVVEHGCKEDKSASKFGSL